MKKHKLLTALLSELNRDISQIPDDLKESAHKAALKNGEVGSVEYEYTFYYILNNQNLPF